MNPTAWFLNLHPDTVSHLSHWDVQHLLAAMADVGVDVYEGPAWPHDEPPACVAIAGQHHASPEDVERLDHLLDPWRYVDDLVVIVTSDEASLFPWWEIDDLCFRWWISTPRRGPHGTMPPHFRFFGEGPGPVPDDGWPIARKDLDVSFLGQVTTNRRREAVAALRALPDRWTVEVVETSGFMQGLPRDAYLRHLSRSRVVVCPAGAQTADSFRLYEAIECGAVPIVESRTPDGYAHGVWDLMYGPLTASSPTWTLGDVVPFPIVGDWSALEHWVSLLLDDGRWEQVAAECQRWWWERKADLRRWLREDLRLDS